MVQSEDHRQRLNQEPLNIHSWRGANNIYRHVELRGRFDSQRMFFVEGQSHQGKSGFLVVGVFDTDQGRFLVNRGWISLAGNTAVDPEVETPIESVNIRGVLWPKSPRIAGARTIDTQVRWPARVRGLDIDAMAARTGAFAQEIRLVQGSEGVLTPAPLAEQFKTAMHFGYALQWLVIGTLILAGYWYFVLRPTSEDESDT